MTQRQINYFTMVQAVLKWLTDNSAVWSGIAPIAEEVSQLQIIAAKLNASYLKQTENKTPGFTSNKDIAFENMELIAYNIAIKIRAYARKINNMVIFNAVNFSLTDLSHGPEEDQVQHCKMIKDQAIANLADLTDYKVTATNITTLQTAIETAEPLIAERDDAKGMGIESTGALANDFKEIVKIFIKLDELIEALIPASEETFENTYFATRRINDHKGGGGKSKAPEIPPPAV